MDDPRNQSYTIIISLETEFIENEKEDVSKQDCELNAAKRLLKKNQKSLSETSNLYPGRCIVCGRTNHEALQERIPMGVPFYTERYKTEKLSEGFNNQKNVLYRIEHLLRVVL